MFTEVPIQKAAQVFVIVFAPLAWMVAGGIVWRLSYSRFVEWERDAYHDVTRWVTLILVLVIGATRLVAPQFVLLTLFLLSLGYAVWWPWYCRYHQIAPDLWWHQVTAGVMFVIGAGMMLYRQATGAFP